MVLPPLSFSFWMLLILAWKPLYYLVRYALAVVRKDDATATVYGANLHTWITQLWGLIL